MLKKWQKRLKTLINKFGFQKKLETGELTADEQKQLFAEYEKEYGVTFEADREANEDDPDTDKNILSESDQKELANMFGEAAPKTVPDLKDKVIEQKAKIETLEKDPEPDTPVNVVRADPTGVQILSRTLGHTSHTAEHLFGIANPLMARGNWFNELTVTKKGVVSSISKKQRNEFKDAFESFSSQLKARAQELEDHNMLSLLDFDKLISGTGAIDYTHLYDQAGEFIVRRTDLILAFLRTLPTVDHIFPMRSNIQNKEIAPGANFGELSQGYRKGKIFKGQVNFTAEIYSVVDVMFKFLFYDLILLEKQYIGYLNKEGSNVIKWTFIEWIMVHFGTILRNEQNRRRIVGVRTPQQKVVANPAMFAANGGLRAIQLVEDGLKVYPNKSYRTYNDSTIVDYFESFWDFHTQLLPSIEGYEMNANLKHRPWYIRHFREKYGRDTDFSGVTAGMINDVDANIKWVPNMPINNFKVWITTPGNVENHEDKPFEMLDFYFERDWEEMGVMSRWKEGSGLQQAGIQYKTLQELIATEYENQWIFTNFPATTLDADVTTLDARLNSLFETGANTTATNISNIIKFKGDVVIRIVCGSLENATTVKKEGKFKIKEDFVPTAIDDFIELYPEWEDYEEEIEGEMVTLSRPSGNFLELSRRVS